MKSLEEQKYPIGKFKKPEVFNDALINLWIKTIEEFPSLLRKEVESLNKEQLNTPYRKEGWHIRQVVNHCADSHLNSFIRFKLALTEDNPTIKPYLEDKWAELEDSKNYDVEPALQILEGLHKRWTVLLRSMDKEDFNRTFFHPETKKNIDLKTNLALYHWHCKHHLAHITELKKEKNW